MNAEQQEYGWFYGLVVEQCVRLMYAYHGVMNTAFYPKEFWKVRDKHIQAGWQDWQKAAPPRAAIIDSVALSVIVEIGMGQSEGPKNVV